MGKAPSSKGRQSQGELHKERERYSGRGLGLERGKGGFERAQIHPEKKRRKAKSTR